MIRLLHTSDWHLGVSTGPASRIDEQRSFLEWLLQTLRERDIDVLLVAGDIFDSMHPSAEAQAIYYRFLARVAETGVRDVVVIGGNHDSAAGLDAPKAVLAAVEVHTVGGVPTASERLKRMIVPLRARGSDDVRAVCLAVPYVHEYRLGIRTTDLDRTQTRAELRSAFSTLYSELADGAAALHPDVPIVATGHLTVGDGPRREDYPHEIHQVGNIEGLPVDIFDPRIRYTALGHIHRGYPVDGDRAWYSGTPIPYSLTEMATARRVLVVDIDGSSPARVESLKVPRSRDLLQLTGSPEAVLAELASLRWATPLPPLVHVCVETPMVEPGLNRQLNEAIAGHAEGARPVLVEVRQRSVMQEVETSAPPLPSLDELRPEEVFGLVCDARQVTGDERTHLETAFATLAAADAETVNEMVSAIDIFEAGPEEVS